MEVIAYNVAVIDAQASKIDGTSAEIEIKLAKGLDRHRVRLGYRIYVSDEIKWLDDPAFDRGRVTLQIPLASMP